MSNVQTQKLSVPNRVGDRIRVVIASVLGSAFEVYDFTLFAMFAVAVAPVFFPSASDDISLLLTMATFGAGAVARPVGAIVLGNLGDRIGRKKVLSFSLIIMAACSVLIGLLPGYSVIGIWAPILVVLARVGQGFSAGGEQGSATTFMIEHVPENKRGLYLGFFTAGTMGATLVSAGFGLLLHRTIGQDATMDWGWRIPFLFGGLIAPLGLYIRHKLPESEEFVRYKERRGETEDRPSITILPLIYLMLAFIPSTVIYYLVVVNMPTFLHSQSGVPLDLGLNAAFVASLFIIICMPLAGALSDKIGRRPVLLSGCILVLICGYPFYRLLLTVPTIGTVIVIQIAFAAFVSLATAPMPAFAARYFSTGRRSLGMSVVMSIPIAIFGTGSPPIVTWLTIESGSPMASAYYLMAMTALGTIALILLPESPSLAKRNRGLCTKNFIPGRSE